MEKDKNSESWFSKNLGVILVCLMVVAVLSGLVVTLVYASYFDGPISRSYERWGAFGDFLGGTLNPLFGILGLLALLLTIDIQRKELSLSRIELAASAQALKEQSRSLKLQNFENTFFQMIKLHNDIIEGIMIDNSVYDEVENLKGRACFEELSRRYRQNLSMRYNYFLGEKGISYEFNDEDLLGIINSAYSEFNSRNQSHTGHYFRNLYTIIKMVDESDVSNKKKYVNILRSQISSYEFELLFYNCLWHIGANKFKYLIEKYEFLENMDTSSLVMHGNSLVKLYGESAFGEFA